MQGVLINCNMRENLYMDNIMINDLQQQTGKTSSIFFAWFTSGQYSTYISFFLFSINHHNLTRYREIHMYNIYNIQ